MFKKYYKEEKLSEIKYRILKKQLYQVFKEDRQERMRLKYLLPVVTVFSSVGCQGCQTMQKQKKSHIKLITMEWGEMVNLLLYLHEDKPVLLSKKYM